MSLNILCNKCDMKIPRIIIEWEGIKTVGVDYVFYAKYNT